MDTLSTTYSRAEVRRRVEALIRTDSDMSQFFLDYFPNIQKKIARGNSRQENVNLLLESIDAEIINERLDDYIKDGNAAPKIFRSRKQPKHASKSVKNVFLKIVLIDALLNIMIQLLGWLADQLGIKRDDRLLNGFRFTAIVILSLSILIAIYRRYGP